MSTAVESRPAIDPSEGRIVVSYTNWGDYEKMLQIVGDRRIHVTYNKGTMEVRMPSPRHEQVAQSFGFFIMELAAELEIDCEAFGMATWRRPDLERGLEADQCYYIANVAIVRQGKEPNLEVDPPPDLAVEVDITASSIDRMIIYAQLRVPEIWRYDGRRVSMFQLQPDGRYRSGVTSLSFAELRPADVERFIEQGPTTPKPQWVRAIRDWVRAELIPRRVKAQSQADGSSTPD